MRVGDYCNRAVQAVTPAERLSTAAAMMLDQHMGFLVVVVEGDPRRVPIGVVTDRDIIVRAHGRTDPQPALTVADVMTRRPIIVHDRDDLTAVRQAIRMARIRRAPVVDAAGTLVGVISVDDCRHQTPAEPSAWNAAHILPGNLSRRASACT